MRKLHVTILAALWLASAVVTLAHAGKFGNRIHTAECWHFCIFIDRDLAVADELLTPDFVWHYGFARILASPGQDSVSGSEPAKVASQVFNAGLSQLKIVHNQVFAHKHFVEVRWTATGVHTGELLGYAPTGCQITLTGNDLFRLREGQIAELWQETDLLDLFTQLQQKPCSP